MRWGVIAFVLLGLAWTATAQEAEPPPAKIDAEEKAQEPPADEKATGGEEEQEEPAEPKEEKKPAAQDKKPLKERLPGPEHEKLYYFVGKWKGKVHLMRSTYRDESWTTSDISFVKICKGFFVSHDYTQKPDPNYPETYSGRGTTTYDATARKYRMWWFDSLGQMQDGHGKWDGDSLRFEFDLTWGGKKTKQVLAYTFVSETEYTLKMEAGYADQPLRTILEATYTKQP